MSLSLPPAAHLLLVVVLLCSGFITSKPKVDDSQVLDVIPANLIDAAFNSGVKRAPGCRHPRPWSNRQNHSRNRPRSHRNRWWCHSPNQNQLHRQKKSSPDEVKPEEKPDFEKPKPKPHKIEVDLKPVVRKNTRPWTTPRRSEKAAKEAAKEAKRAHDQKLRAFQNAARSIKETHLRQPWWMFRRARAACRMRITPRW